MTPAVFMACTKFIVAATIEEKIDLFFKMIDADGNGMLSWDEIHYICTEQLSLFSFGDTNEFVDNLACFFTDYMFEQCGFDTSVFNSKKGRKKEEEKSGFWYFVTDPDSQGKQDEPEIPI